MEQMAFQDHKRGVYSASKMVEMLMDEIADLPFDFDMVRLCKWMRRLHESSSFIHEVVKKNPDLLDQDVMSSLDQAEEVKKLGRDFLEKWTPSIPEIRQEVDELFIILQTGSPFVKSRDYFHFTSCHSFIF